MTWLRRQHWSRVLKTKGFSSRPTQDLWAEILTYGHINGRNQEPEGRVSPIAPAACPDAADILKRRLQRKILSPHDLGVMRSIKLV